MVALVLAVGSCADDSALPDYPYEQTLLDAGCELLTAADDEFDLQWTCASADLAGADLTWANLVGADLTDADLTDADLSGANLTDVIGYP